MQENNENDTQMEECVPTSVHKNVENVENVDNYVEHGIEATSYETTDVPADQAQNDAWIAHHRNLSPDNIYEETTPEMSIETQRETLFKNILKEAKMRIKTDDLIALKTKKGNTQASEQPSIALIKMILDELGIIYKQAGSQQSKDFRNVGGIGLDIEVKKTDSKTVIFNDTLPNSNIWYLIMFTGKKIKRAPSIPPGIMGINGGEFIKDSEWVHKYQQEIDAIKNKYCRGCGKRELSGIMKAYVRPTYSADITKFLKRLLE
jgi:hypothetical protein